ncbi:hypothetical protein ACFQO7_17900 [Catellatospora aurea]|uniref:Nucleic-acid-binding Zn-ribbon protein n=1 Tax=Catellatospora aurea TaxID=1337874 RepID=A0ABW2GWE6_9ACTN
MGTSKSKRHRSALVTVAGRRFTCLVCGQREFTSREILLNTPGLELFDLAWANRSSLGVICMACGYVHEFVGKAVEFWTVSGGYPATAT